MKTFKELKTKDLDEADIQNLIVHIQDITKDMIKALKRNDQRTIDGLYKNLGKVLKWKRIKTS